MVRAFHSKDTYISLDSEDISAYCNNLAITDAADEVEVTGFGDTEKQYVPGFRDIAATLSGNYGDDDGEAGVAKLLADLRDSGDSVPLVYGPAGNGTGKVMLTYDAKVLSFNPTSAIGGAVTFQANLRLSNPATGNFS